MTLHTNLPIYKKGCGAGSGVGFTTPLALDYNRPVSSKKGLIGFCSPLQFAAKSRNRTVCGFFVGTLYGGADGRAQALPVFAPRVARSANLSALPPNFAVGRQLFNATQEANMANSVSKRASARVALINGQPTTTSRNIAETFVRSHRNVVQRIKQLDCSPEFRSANFSAHSYIDPQNKQTYTEYNITRDGFAFLCMGFTGAKAAVWKERYIHTFNKMADKLAGKPAPRVIVKEVVKPAPALPAPSLLGRRWLVSYDGTGKEQVTPVALSAAVVDPSNADELAAFLQHMVPQHLLGEALATLTGRTLSLLNHRQRETAAATATGKPLQLSQRTPA